LRPLFDRIYKKLQRTKGGPKSEESDPSEKKVPTIGSWFQKRTKRRGHNSISTLEDTGDDEAQITPVETHEIVGKWDNDSGS
jgi:hypothetical protein